ncbi:MAG: enoyl-CoA hydratase [Burkholderiales bacterium 12-64-5]|nr:MAG: enoyl-CoA hydratase [Burkholderiales bacterium 12-64-5]
MSEHLKFSIEDGIATILLDRQERMNAFTFEMIAAWTEALQQCRTDPAIKVVVVTGSGSAFCSGGDVIEMADRLNQEPAQRKAELFEKIQRIPLTLEDLDKPVIAAMNGVATGAGLDLALMCDLRYAAKSARFAETYMKIGLVPGAGGAHFLPRIVGTAKALELFFTADFVDAEEALRIGLVNKVIDDHRLMEEVMAIARRIARAPELPLRFIKRAIYQGLRNDLRTNLDLISSHYAVVTSTQEHKAAVDRFITLWEMAGEVLTDPIIKEATEALKTAGPRVANPLDAAGMFESNRELWSLHELIGHRLFQILVGQNKGRIFSV